MLFSALGLLFALVIEGNSFCISSLESNHKILQEEILSFVLRFLSQREEKLWHRNLQILFSLLTGPQSQSISIEFGQSNALELLIKKLSSCSPQLQQRILQLVIAATAEAEIRLDLSKTNIFSLLPKLVVSPDSQVREASLEIVSHLITYGEVEVILEMALSASQSLDLQLAILPGLVQLTRDSKSFLPSDIR